jgi:hypothetical protein
VLHQALIAKFLMSGNMSAAASGHAKTVELPMTGAARHEENAPHEHSPEDSTGS